MKAVTIGCDPEVFLRHKKSGEFVSAHGLIKGTKEAPHRVALGAVQVDGMACEFNTDPAYSKEEFYQNVTGVFSTLQGMLPNTLELAKGVPVAKFTPEVFKAQPFEAIELGCEPDYDAYTGKENPRPAAANKFMRTAAGHIHIGFKNTNDPKDTAHMQTCCEFVQMLDIFLGLDSLSYDHDFERRELYGKAGAFRPKTYGVEYRVLSNAWLSSKALIERVYENTMMASEVYLGGGRYPSHMYEKAQKIINTNQTQAAAVLLKQAREHFGLES